MNFLEAMNADIKEHGGDWREFVWSDEGVEIVKESIIDQGRWSTFHKMVVKYNDRFWAIEYDTGSTEYQEGSGEYEVYEVKPVEVTVTKYPRCKK